MKTLLLLTIAIFVAVPTFGQELLGMKIGQTKPEVSAVWKPYGIKIGKHVPERNIGDTIHFGYYRNGKFGDNGFFTTTVLPFSGTTIKYVKMYYEDGKLAKAEITLTDWRIIAIAKDGFSEYDTSKSEGPTLLQAIFSDDGRSHYYYYYYRPSRRYWHRPLRW